MKLPQGSQRPLQSTHTCTHIYVHAAPRLAAFPAPYPPTQSRPPASCFLGAPPRAFTSPLSAFTQSGGPSAPVPSGCLSSAKTPVTAQLPPAPPGPAVRAASPSLSCPPRRPRLPIHQPRPPAWEAVPRTCPPPTAIPASPRLSHPCPISFFDQPLSNVWCASRMLLPSPQEPRLWESRPLFAYFISF